MNLSQLYYFKKLAELQHYTRAAKELFITQPTLSDAISSLEKEIEVPLFQRDGRKVELTLYGEEFYEYVDASIAKLEEGITVIQRHKEIAGGVINVGTAFTTLDEYLHPLLNNFSAEYGPDTRINIYQGFTNYLTQGLHDELFDVIFCGKREEETEIEYIPVLYRELVLCIRDDHPLAQHDRISFDELRSEEMYTYSRGTPIGEQVHKMLSEHDLKNAIQVYDDDITMASFLSFKEGVSSLMLDSLGLKLFENLVIVPVDEVPKEFYCVYLSYHKRHLHSAAVEAFISFVKEQNI